jgi:hypothetical protein
MLSVVVSILDVNGKERKNAEEKVEVEAALSTDHLYSTLIVHVPAVPASVCSKYLKGA